MTNERSKFSKDNKLITDINYYNTNSLLVNVVNNEPTFGAIYAWQGIRYLGENIYLICGTSSAGYNGGVVYVGDVNCINGIEYSLNVPNSTATSVYGPDYNQLTGLYTFVGNYNNAGGFVYLGQLINDELLNSVNYSYPNVNQLYEYTFLHSSSNGYIVGNSGNINSDTRPISYIYNINNLNEYLIKINVPYSKVTSTYGIWYNEKYSYTIVGGSSPLDIPFIDIYQDINIKENPTLTPFGCGYIADYDSEKNIITNWTLIYYKNNYVHIQGISRNNDGKYLLSADVISLDGLTRNGYLIEVSRDINNNFIYNDDNWILLNYKADNNGYSSSNSTANNCVVGLYIPYNSNNPNIAYQASTNTNINLCSSNEYQDIVLNNENLLFDYKIIDTSFITYNNGIFIITESGLYSINLNIYIKNTDLSAIIFQVNYSVNGEKCNFSIALKGVDENGTSTAHGLVLPCVFTTKFNVNDILYVKNISNGTVKLSTNYCYLKNCVNSLISITKIN